MWEGDVDMLDPYRPGQAYPEDGSQSWHRQGVSIPVPRMMYYKATDPVQYPSGIVSLARQTQKVWRDFMNLETQAAVKAPWLDMTA